MLHYSITHIAEFPTGLPQSHGEIIVLEIHENFLVKPPEFFENHTSYKKCGAGNHYDLLAPSRRLFQPFIGFGGEEKGSSAVPMIASARDELRIHRSPIRMLCRRVDQAAEGPWLQTRIGVQEEHEWRAQAPCADVASRAKSDVRLKTDNSGTLRFGADHSVVRAAIVDHDAINVLVYALQGVADDSSTIERDNNDAKCLLHSHPPSFSTAGEVIWNADLFEEGTTSYQGGRRLDDARHRQLPSKGL